MATSAQLAVQTAVYTLLSGDATLLAIMTDGVFDAVPADSEPTKFVSIGDGSELPDRTFGGNGRRVKIAVRSSAKDEESASGYDVAKRGNARVVELLDGTTYAITGWTLVLSQLSPEDETQSYREEDLGRQGETWRHVVSLYEIIVEPA